MAALHNINIIKDRRKDLRNNSTPAEKLLWSQLKNSQLEGKKFRRQHSVGFYILDFYCPEQKLCVELDGNQHFENDNIEYDLERTKYLESIGIKVLRIANTELYENLDAVLNKIKSTFSSPPEFLGGERGVV